MAKPDETLGVWGPGTSGERAGAYREESNA